MSNRLRNARRTRGWSQARLVHEIERYASRSVVPVASRASLRVYVSEWENGRRNISDEYAVILRSLLGLTDVELRREEERDGRDEGYARLISQLDDSLAVGTSVLESLTQQTELLRTMDRQLGAARLVDQMQAHLTRLQETLSFTVLSQSRRPLARALAEAASLAAWQALDVGAADRAWRHYELAKSAAREADDPLYLAHAMGEQAYVLADAGRPALGMQLIAEAKSAMRKVRAPRLAAWLSAAHAELAALSGQSDDCHRFLDTAAHHLSQTVGVRSPDLPAIFLDQAHLSRWRGHSLALLGDENAVSELLTALDVMDHTFVRAASGIRCDLAQAYIALGEPHEARAQLQEARSLANQTGSARYRQRIERIKSLVGLVTDRP